MSKQFQIDVPHVKAGHNEFKFDVSNPEDVKRAETMFKDMARMGYTFFVEKDGQTTRVTSFDAAQGVYRVGDKEIPAEGSTATASAPKAGGCAVADGLPLSVLE